MEAQHNLSRVLRHVDRGGSVEITRRKKVVAEMGPPRRPGGINFPDFEARARATWGEPWAGVGTDELIDQSRGDR